MRVERQKMMLRWSVRGNENQSVLFKTLQQTLLNLLRDAALVVQFNLRAFFSVRTWPWMMLFYKLRPLLRSAQVEKELAALNEDYAKLKEAFDRFVNLPS